MSVVRPFATIFGTITCEKLSNNDDRDFLLKFAKELASLISRTLTSYATSAAMPPFLIKKYEAEIDGQIREDIRMLEKSQKRPDFRKLVIDKLIVPYQICYLHKVNDALLGNLENLFENPLEVFLGKYYAHLVVLRKRCFQLLFLQEKRNENCVLCGVPNDIIVMVGSYL